MADRYAVEGRLAASDGYRPDVDPKLRGIYLNDHLAGATAGAELARRAAGSNAEGELGDFLARLAEDIEEDRQTLVEVMSRLGVKRDPVKQSFAWGAEKVGRLKLNGRILGYSPLSRLVEIEGLHIGIAGKLSLWQVLAATSASELAGIDLEALIARAQAQLAAIEPFRIAAAREAFGTAAAAGG
jgi:hypothetical protein